MPKNFEKILVFLVSLATISTVCIAAIALIPAFGQWLSPREPIRYITPSGNASPTPIMLNTLAPTSTKVSIESLNRLALLTLFEIPRETNRPDVDRMDTIIRRNRSESVITIPNYPLSSQFSLDEYGYLYTDGKAFDLPIGNDVGKNLLNVDLGKWENYLGVFDFAIPTDKNLQFCGFYIRSEGGGLNWQDSQRFVYSADVTNGFVVERASWLEIKECYDVPSNNWAKRNAQNAAASSTTDSVYYWDKLSNVWVQLK